MYENKNVIYVEKCASVNSITILGVLVFSGGALFVHFFLLELFVGYNYTNVPSPSDSNQYSIHESK